MDRHVPDGDPALPLGPSHSGPAPLCRRVVVIDDNETAAQSLALILKLEGYEVRVAHDGESALEVVAGFRPEAVLSDIGLPRIDGYELARRFRRDPRVSAGLKVLRRADRPLRGRVAPSVHRGGLRPPFPQAGQPRGHPCAAGLAGVAGGAGRRRAREFVEKAPLALPISNCPS